MPEACCCSRPCTSPAWTGRFRRSWSAGDRPARCTTPARSWPIWPSPSRWAASLADIALLRAQPDLFGPVASDPTASRLINHLARDEAKALKALRAARALARERAWDLAGPAAPGSDGELIPLDLDATIVIAHSDKQHAAPTWKHTFGFHPMTVFADHGPGGSGEPLAIVLRPGNAGSNTAAAAPRGALLYPQHSREKHGGRFMGPMAYLDPKGEGDNSMSGKQQLCSGV